MGSLPAILALLVLLAIFVILKPNTFPSTLNIANLFQQGAVVATIAMGLVFVLLLGEIDLSAGFTSGVCGAVLATGLVGYHWPWYVALLAALVDRSGRRPDHRHAGRAGRHPVVHRHAGDVPGPPGRRAADHRAAAATSRSPTR